SERSVALDEPEPPVRRHDSGGATLSGDAAAHVSDGLRSARVRAAVAGLGQLDRGVGNLTRLLRPGEGELGVLAVAFAVPALDVDQNDLARGQLAEEDLLRQLVLDLALDRATQRTGAEHRIEPALGEQALRLVGELDGHVLVLQL